MNAKQMGKELRKNHPKTMAKLDRRWDFKMMDEVSDFTFGLLEQINPKAKAAIGKEEWLIHGPEIEAQVWKLLKRVRRITQHERVSR